MDETTARAKGLCYAGSYDETKLALIRKAGYKAYHVVTPPDPLSRGYHGPSHSIFTEPKYAKDQHAKAVNERLARSANDVQCIWSKYNKEMQEHAANIAANRNWLRENGYEVPVVG